jgi:hypothetical protein
LLQIRYYFWNCDDDKDEPPFKRNLLIYIKEFGMMRDDKDEHPEKQSFPSDRFE